MYGLALVFAAAITGTNYPTTDPGAELCAPFAGPDNSFVRMTATNEASEQSSLSNTATIDNGQDLCWRNPTDNVDGSVLDDLAFVTYYYASTPFDEDDFGNPPPDTPSLDSVTAVQDGTAVVATNLLIGVTGEPVDITWDDAWACTQVQVLPYGGSVPVATGNFSSTAWSFTPPRAGLFSVRMRECDTTDWLNSEDQGFLLYFKLAAPTGGGLG